MIRDDQNVDPQIADKRQKYEDFANRNPAKYQRKVTIAAIAGFSAPFVFLFILTFLAGLLGAYVINGGSGAAVALKVVLAVGGLGFLIARSMLFRLPPPNGRVLTPEDTPELFAEIEKVRLALDGPEIHEVYLDNELNAAITQTPRFGMVGPSINRLIIGLPLLHALERDEFLSVIAHEYGHIAGGHGKSATWIYRTRQGWSRLYEEFSYREGWLYAPLRMFIHRFAPWFNDLSFPLARSNEYQADAAAAEVVGADIAGRALLRVSIAAHFLDEDFWPAVSKRMRFKPQPDISPLSAMQKAFAKVYQSPKAKDWLKISLADKTDFADTHPALSDRLKALGERLSPLKPLSNPAVTFLGTQNEKLRKEFDLAWRETIRAEWMDEYEFSRSQKKRLQELDARVAKGEALNANDANDRAGIRESIASQKDALEAYKDAVRWDSKNATAWLRMASLLAESKHPKAIDFAERALALNPLFAVDAASIIHRYHSVVGNKDAASAAAERWQKANDIHEAGEGDVYHFDKSSPMRAHALSAEEIAPVSKALGELHGVSEAYMLYKESDTYPNYSAYHLIIVPKFADGFNYEAAHQTLRSLSVDFTMFFWFAVEQDRWMRSKAKKIAGSSVEVALPMDHSQAA